ncbi:non-ribosomal peptide synthetase [Dickeya dadantii]|uniref:non-ribosomal peptide synthetase n=1 Tax=Dickeya dadantii TaxID=204038 RepID=UPI0003A1D980|nr:non-ribosomal peptide synthetase [Dickeya dadantii]
MDNTKGNAKSQLLATLRSQTSSGKSAHPAIKQLASVVPGNGDIIRVDNRPFYPVSFAQKRMYLLHQLDPKSTAYNLPLALYIEGKIDIERFTVAVKQLTERHECLRSGIYLVEQEIMQSIEQNAALAIHYTDVRDDDIPALMKAFSQPFDLAKPPLARIALATVERERYLLLLDMHHIIADGISQQIILRDLMFLYNGMTLSQLPLRYRDYAVWQEQWLLSAAAQKQQHFWLEMYATDVPVLDLATDFPRPDILTSVGAHYEFVFTANETDSMKSLARQLNVTTYTLFLGVFSLLLAKDSGQDDIVVGSPVAGRRQIALQELVGMFVNTIALRCKPEATKRVADYIKELGITVSSALEAQDYPFEALVEKTRATRSINRNPLFDVMFSLSNMKKTTSQFKELSISPYPFQRNVANFDLELYMTEENQCIEFRLEYNTQLFIEETIQRMASHFRYLARQLVDKPEQAISALKLLDAAEQAETLARHRGPAVIAEDCVFTQVFEQQVEQTPNALAAICDKRQLSYAELNSWANSVARGLIGKEFPRETLIALWLDRELEFLAAMIGVFKASYSYMPVDPALPHARIRTLLAESKSRLIITEKQYLSIAREIAGPNVEIVLIETLLTRGELSTNPDIPVVPEQLAYIIFTSGSTGKPKGAMVEHRGMLNHLRAKIDVLQLTHHDRVAETATQSFDVSVWQFLSALMTGGVTVIFNGVSAWQPSLVLEGICKHRVTVFETVPSHLIVLLDEIEDSLSATGALPLRWLMLNGEQLLSELCRRWFVCYPDIPLINAYGPTECSDDVTHHLITKSSPLERSAIPIGDTVRGMWLYVLDEYLQLVPRGCVGELYIGGIGVGRGYLDDPEKTAAAFLPDVFVVDPTKRMYKTGDLVRELADGSLEYLGRRDHQVKINGMRVELSEIEHALLATGRVREAVVVAGQWGHLPLKQLCAYVVLKAGNELALLQNEIESILPGYMTPVFWVCLSSLPLLVNGKVDRKALPYPKADESTAIPLIVPVTEEQRLMAKFWADVLDLDAAGIGLQHEFFKLGGTSLKAMRLVSRIKRETGVGMPFSAIFANSILQGFTELYQQARQSSQAPQPLNSARHYTFRIPALPEHQRIYRMEGQMPREAVFNMPYRLLVEGALDAQKVEAAFRAVCRRHWMMTANIVSDNNGELSLFPNSAADIAFSYSDSTEEDIEYRWHQFVRPFAIADEPLFRMQLLTVNPQRHYFFFDNHTIAADFTSKALILREFVSLYLGHSLPQPGMDYPTYVQQRLARANSAIALAQRNAWQRMFSRGALRLQSTDAQTLTEVSAEKAKHLTLRLDETRLGQISALSKISGVSEHNICQAAFSLALASQFNQREFFLLSLVTDRDQPEYDNIVGLVFDSLPVWQQIDVAQSVTQLLVQTQYHSRQSYEKREYPAILLYEERSEQDGNWSNGYFDTTMVWVEHDAFNFSQAGFNVKDIPNDNIMGRFDLRLEAYREQSSLTLILEYRERIFYPETAEKIFSSIDSALIFMVNNPDAKIAAWGRYV